MVSPSLPGKQIFKLIPLEGSFPQLIQCSVRFWSWSSYLILTNLYQLPTQCTTAWYAMLMSNVACAEVDCLDYTNARSLGDIHLVTVRVFSWWSHSLTNPSEGSSPYVLRSLVVILYIEIGSKVCFCLDVSSSAVFNGYMTMGANSTAVVVFYRLDHSNVSFKPCQTGILLDSALSKQTLHIKGVQT